jgi:hypothetical protein
MVDSKAPVVSIVLLVGDLRGRSAAALRSVLEQDGLDRAEVLLIDAGLEGHGSLPGAEHPQVRTIQPPPDESFGGMRALGVRQARGQIIAFLEDHVMAKPGWLKAILRAFEGPWTVVGAEVENANPEVGLSRIIELINYGLWSPPMPRGEMDLLAGNNIAYRKDALLRYGDDLAQLLLCDTVQQWRIAQDGGRLFAEPAVALRHLNPTTLSACLQSEFLYHWCFAAMRARHFRWSLWRRLRYAALSPAIPWLRFARLVRLARRKPSEAGVLNITAGASVLLLLHAAVLGQIFGLALGSGGADRRFTHFELNVERPAASAG